MIYLVVSKELSNGFEYTTNIKSFTNKEVAEKQFAYEINLLKEQYPEEVEGKIDASNYSFQDENNMKGNGHSVQLRSEEEMMDEIINAVENSKDREKWIYTGIDSSYVLDAKVLNIEDMSAISWGISEPKEELYQPFQIVKRPYDPEQPSSDDFIYDVRMRVNGEIQTESLEEIGINILFAIYDNIISKF
jgi:hypothetical protein